MIWVRRLCPSSRWCLLRTLQGRERCRDIPFPVPKKPMMGFSEYFKGNIYCLVNFPKLSTLQNKILGLPGSQPQHHWCLGHEAVVRIPVHCRMLSSICGSLPFTCQAYPHPSCDHQKYLQALHSDLSPDQTFQLRTTMLAWERLRILGKGLLMATKYLPVILWIHCQFKLWNCVLDHVNCKICSLTCPGS